MLISQAIVWNQRLPPEVILVSLFFGKGLNYYNLYKECIFCVYAISLFLSTCTIFKMLPVEYFGVGISKILRKEKR